MIYRASRDEKEKGNPVEQGVPPYGAQVATNIRF